MLLLVIPLVAASAIAIVVLWAELLHWRARERRLGQDARPGGFEAVVALGFRNRGSRANYLNRYRVRAALRSQDRTAAESVLVLCGGCVGGDLAEAELMGRYARGRGYTGPMRLDLESVSTWENVKNAIPLIEGADTIKIVSNSLHAERARAYLWKLRPDLARRLVRADEYHFGEIALLKPLLAVVGLKHRRRERV